MIERILPSAVVAVEARRDLAGPELFAEEERALGRAVEKRRREFATARACARAALARLGAAAQAIPSGERGEPLWPPGVVGSITHCDGYRACAVAWRRDAVAIGIDAEPDAALPSGVLDAIARPEELEQLRDLRVEHPEVHWDRLLFSAKESLYKAWFPMIRRPLGFEDAVVAFDPRAHEFSARLLVPLDGCARPLALANDPGACPSDLSGRWAACDGVIATAIVLSTRRGALACSPP